MEIKGTLELGEDFFEDVEKNIKRYEKVSKNKNYTPSGEHLKFLIEKCNFDFTNLSLIELEESIVDIDYVVMELTKINVPVKGTKMMVEIEKITNFLNLRNKAEKMLENKKLKLV